MLVHLDYGKTGLDLDLSGVNATIIRPQFVAGLPDEAAAFREAVRNPIGCPPIRRSIKADETVAVVIPDITRALPNERLLTWLFSELDHVPSEHVVILSGTGSHRGNTEAEWIHMVGERIYRNYRCVNHDAADPAALASAGLSSFGYEVFFNREYVNADRRILLGFIEPHFMAGFSGGYKAAFPGVAGLETIMHYHSAENIGHPRSTWGLIEDNPTQDNIRAGGSLLPVDLLINVTLNNRQEITRFFIGDPIEAHEAGCAFCKATAMVRCEEPFPVIVTTNSGYPLDQNLYQSVKGLSAAAEVLEQDGLVLLAARCNDGFPEHGNFRQFIFEHPSAQAMLDTIHSPGFRLMDQWQVQKFAQVLLKGRVGLLSELDEASVRDAHLEPVRDLRARIDQELQIRGSQTRVAILPEGPMTIPYLG
jgi:nickel-dependent lactate racemase